MKMLHTIEPLEARRLLASDWQNVDLPADVDRSAYVSPFDALLVINRLNRFVQINHAASEPLPVREAGSNEPYYDTNGDGHLAPFDALLVISLLNRRVPAPVLTVGVASDSDPNGNSVVLTDSITVVGQTRADSNVALAVSQDGTATELSTTADDTGRFSITVPLQIGNNEIEVSVRNALGYTLHRQLPVARGDLLQDWNAAALHVIREWSTTSDDPYEGRIVTSQPPWVARNLAMIHGAMFDTLNSFEGAYQPYLLKQTPPVDAIAEAAVAAAAHRVASSLYSETDELAIWDASLTESLRQVGDENLESSITFGELIADAFLQARASDGSNLVGEYTAGSEPGEWRRTAPDYLPPLLPAWADVLPFSLQSADQFRPPAPPPLSSQSYADSVDEVMRLGGYGSEARTEDQTEIAIFWADGGGTFTPPGHWNQIASETISTQQPGLLESARTFALLNYAMADAGISAWDAKYAFDLWRPIDAIRYAATDGNDATLADSQWLPLIATPPFPTYTSGHSTFSGAAAEVLTQLFGEDYNFSSEIDRRPSAAQKPLPDDQVVTRHFASFWDAAEEAGVSRIYGGIHFDFDNTTGLEAGQGIGAWTVSRLLQPLSS